MGSLQSQAMLLLANSIVFLCFFGCYKPAKAPLTNKVVFLLELGFILLVGLFIAYDKVVDKNINTQLGFSIALVVVEVLMILLAIVWSFYRLMMLIS